MEWKLHDRITLKQTQITFLTRLVSLSIKSLAIPRVHVRPCLKKMRLKKSALKVYLSQKLVVKGTGMIAMLPTLCVFPCTTYHRFTVTAG